MPIEIRMADIIAHWLHAPERSITPYSEMRAAEAARQLVLAGLLGACDSQEADTQLLPQAYAPNASSSPYLRKLGTHHSLLGRQACPRPRPGSMHYAHWA